MPRRIRLESPWCTALLAVLLACATPKALQAEQLILQLKSGDRISGSLVSEDANRLVLSNAWAPALSVPLDQISRREKSPDATAVATPANPPAPPSTNAVATAKPAPPSAAPAKAAPKPNYWKGEARVGLDLLYNQTERQIYHSRLKLIYERPYSSAPGRFFRNTSDYIAEYGKTDGIKSMDRMRGSNKTDWDLGKRWYVYNLFGAGYDDIRNIEIQYEAGPGFGYHLVTLPAFSLNLEGGANYQAQYRTGSLDVEDLYYRFAEDFTWRIRPRTTLIEKLEIFPRAQLDELRLRFESTLSHELWKNLNLNLTVLNLYDTQPGPKVVNNELQVRSSVGLKF